MPTLLLPHARLAKLSSPKPEKPLQRNPLSAEELKQFRKTAETIEKEPWALMDGGSYLRALCDRSEPVPAALKLYDLHRPDRPNPGSDVDWVDFAPQAPKKIKVLHVQVQQHVPDDAPLENGLEESQAPNPADQASVHRQASKRRRLEDPPQRMANPPADHGDESAAPAASAASAPAAVAMPEAKAKSKPANPGPKAKAKAVCAKPKPKAKAAAPVAALPKVKAKAKAKGAAKAKAQAAPAAGAAAAEEPQYGCKKRYHKNGCKKCQNYRPGYPKPWRKGASKGAD